jgi:hypothetical protein
VFDPPTDPPAPSPPTISIHVPSAEDIAHTLLGGIMALLGDAVQNGMHTGQDLLHEVADSPINLYSRTPPELTYAHPAVIEMFSQLRLVAFGTLAFLLVVAGFTHMAAPIMGQELPLKQLVVRTAFALAISSTALIWGARMIDMVNALDGVIMSTSLGAIILPWPNALDPVQMVAALLYAVVLLYLFFKLAMRMVWLLILLAIAPVALILFVVPQLAFVTTGWSRQFFGNLFGQPLTLIVLRLGASVLVGHEPSPWDYFIGAAVFLVALQMPVWFSLLALGSRSGGTLAAFSPSRLLPLVTGFGLPARVAVAGVAVAGGAARFGSRVNRGMRSDPPRSPEPYYTGQP